MEVYRENVSVVLRYAKSLHVSDYSLLEHASLREGARIVEIPPYRGVKIDILDLSSISASGTFKDWVACISIANFAASQDEIFLAQSSGNTGNALALYASKMQRRGVILYPEESRDKLRGSHHGVSFVEVMAPEAVIKKKLQQYSESNGVSVIPTFESQIEGNKLRAYFLCEASRRLQRKWDWHAQALSSGYGVFGFYRGMKEVAALQTDSMPPPKILGIQQEAVSPYVEHVTKVGSVEAEVIEPTLFRRHPPDSFLKEMNNICASVGGAMIRVSNSRYKELERVAIDALTSSGVPVAVEKKSRQPFEKAGVISLVGTFDAVDRSIVLPGQRVLAVFTGGAFNKVNAVFNPTVTSDEMGFTNALDFATESTRHA